MQKVKVGTCLYVSMWKSWTMKIFIASPLCMGSQQKKICYSTREAILLVFFPWADLRNVRAFAKTASLTLIAATLANAWQEPCTILAIDWRVSREQEPCWRKPGKTQHNPVELNWRKPGTQRNLAAPGGAAEPSGTRRNPAETGGTRRNPAEPGGTWRNLAEPGGNLAETGGKKVSWRGGWLGV